jgi:hypothetical protein
LSATAGAKKEVNLPDISKKDKQDHNIVPMNLSDSNLSLLDQMGVSYGTKKVLKGKHSADLW